MTVRCPVNASSHERVVKAARLAVSPFIQQLLLCLGLTNGQPQRFDINSGLLIYFLYKEVYPTIPFIFKSSWYVSIVAALFDVISPHSLNFHGLGYNKERPTNYAQCFYPNYSPHHVARSSPTGRPKGCQLGFNVRNISPSTWQPPSISFDSISSRPKIVIRPKKVETDKIAVLPSRLSIFKTSGGKPARTNPPSPLPASQHRSPAEPNVQASPNPITSAVKISKKSGTIEDSKVKKKQPQSSKSMSPHLIRAIPIPPCQSGSIDMTTPAPEPLGLPISLVRNSIRPSPYAEEYAQCPCTARGQFPCQRCQVMLLADRWSSFTKNE